MENANLRLANMHGADMRGARLVGACFDAADLAGARLPDGALYIGDDCLARFTDEDHPTFQATLETIGALGTESDDTDLIENGDGDKPRLPWKEFVQQTYGSLADDPIAV